jgi:hypothetical protein
MLVFISGEFRKTLAGLSRQFAASADHRFKFQKRSQLFVGAHNETLSVAPMESIAETQAVRFNRL